MKKEIGPTTAIVPCPVVLLSVIGKDRPNIITLSWVANVCSKPPMVVVGIRQERYSYAMVREAGEFVLNIPSKSKFEAAEFAGTKSGRSHDKFKECNLTPVPSSKVKSPMIKECPINIECKVTNTLSLGTHDLFIAEVVAVHLDKTILNDKEDFDPTKIELFTYLPLSGQYWSLGKQLS